MHLPALLIVTALISLVACHTTPSIYPVPQHGAQLKGNPDVVMVTRRDGNAVTIHLPVVARDSIIGWLDEPTPSHQPTLRAAVALGDIQQISNERPSQSVGKSLFTGVGIIAVALLFFLVAALVSYGIDPSGAH